MNNTEIRARIDDVQLGIHEVRSLIEVTMDAIRYKQEHDHDYERVFTSLKFAERRLSELLTAASPKNILGEG